MLTAYFDAAGMGTDPFLAVAGFVSSVKCWLDFEKEWAAHLVKFGVPYSHMKEFAHFKGPFKGWDKKESIRRQFLGEAIEIILRNTFCSFAAAVALADYETILKNAPKLKNLYGNAYCLAARAVMSAAMEWKAAETGFRSTQLNYVFEQGDQGQDQLLKTLNRDSIAEPVTFGPSRCLSTKGRYVNAILPLQSSDMLAYEISKHAKDIKAGREMRAPFNQLRAGSHRWDILDIENLGAYFTAILHSIILDRR